MQGLLSVLKQLGWTLILAYWPGSFATPDTGDEPVPPKPAGDTEPEAAAYGAAVAHVINRPDGIRARAQVSATISAAVAAALAAFAPLTGLSGHNFWPQLLVALAVLSWLVSLWRYILVIAYSYHDHERDITGRIIWPRQTERGEFVSPDETEVHLEKFLAYAGVIRTKVERGTAATKFALALTLSAAAALAAEPLYASPTKQLVVSLNKKGVQAIGRVCTTAIGSRLEAKARPNDLNLSVVPLGFDEGKCADENAVVHVRRGWIEAARWPRDD